MNKNYLRRLIREYHDSPASDTLLGLSDTPETYTGQTGKVLAVNATEDGVEFVEQSGGTGGVDTFTELTDTPSSFVGQGQKILAVNIAEDALEFIDKPLDGADGVGVPAGGTTGQVLAKVDGTDYNTEWVNAGSGSGDMLKSVYDPQTIEADAFDRTNHTGTQTMSTISDAGDSATKNVGTTAGTVAAGDHTHSGMLTTSSSIKDLADVDAMTPTDGQVLTFNGTSNLWEAQDAAAGGGGGWDVSNTFTPVLQRSDGSAHPGIVYLSQVGSYRRLGDVVFFSGEIKWDSCTAENDLRLAGFPYTINHTGTFAISKIINTALPYSTGGSTIYLTQGEFVSGTPRAFLWCSDGLTATSGTGTTDRGFKFSGFYITTEAA